MGVEMVLDYGENDQTILHAIRQQTSLKASEVLILRNGGLHDTAQRFRCLFAVVIACALATEGLREGVCCRPGHGIFCVGITSCTSRHQTATELGGLPSPDFFEIEAYMMLALGAASSTEWS
ncbi:unnamed protein product [Pylaiella littoralis]